MVSDQQVSSFLALGHLVSYDGRADACFERTRRLIRKSFFANAGNKRFLSAPVHLKIALIDRTTKPVWRYRCPRWLASKGILQSESRPLNLMIAAVERLKPLQGESLDAFFLRRKQSASRLARSHGSWEAEHVRLCRTWFEHLSRPASYRSFASKLVRHKDAGWLRSWRRALRPTSADKEVGTRVHAGPVAARWEESLLLRTSDFPY